MAETTTHFMEAVEIGRFYVHAHSLGEPGEPSTIVLDLSSKTHVHNASRVGLTIPEAKALRDLLTTAINATPADPDPGDVVITCERCGRIPAGPPLIDGRIFCDECWSLADSLAEVVAP